MIFVSIDVRDIKFFLLAVVLSVVYPVVSFMLSSGFLDAVQKSTPFVSSLKAGIVAA